jgi:rhodanese-related sulfurtransferase
MPHFIELFRQSLSDVKEIMPWDLVARIQENKGILILDVREPSEFAVVHINGSINVPRGILESACEWDYEDTVAELVMARKRQIVVVCRSGNRSLLAAHTMQLIGYENVVSLKTGLRGWNDYEEPLCNSSGILVDAVEADNYFAVKLRSDQMRPKVQQRLTNS